MSVARKTLIGKLGSPGGATLAGARVIVDAIGVNDDLTAAPILRIVDHDGHELWAGADVPTIADQGVWQVELPVTDSADTNPTGWVWRIRTFAGGELLDTVVFSLPASSPEPMHVDQLYDRSGDPLVPSYAERVDQAAAAAAAAEGFRDQAEEAAGVAEQHELDAEDAATSAQAALAGIPASITATLTDNSSAATAVIVGRINTAFAALVAGAPGALDTWLEVTAAIQADQSGLSALTTVVASKADAAATTTALAGKETPAGAQAKVDAAINALVAGAPTALNTLNELAVQLTSDESVAGALTTLVGNIRNLSDSTHVAALNNAYAKRLTGKAHHGLVQPVATPSGDLVFAASVVGVDPRSIGVDGGVYGVYNGHQIWRSLDGNATQQFSGVFTGIDPDSIVNCYRTSAGYVIITTNSASSPNRCHVWFTAGDPFTGSPTWTQVLSTLTTTLTGFARPRTGPDGQTVLMFGSYTLFTPSASLPRWASWDGGQTWTQVHTTTLANTAVNSHNHTGLIRRSGRIYSSEGDGVNAWFGYSDDRGKTWVPIKVPASSPLFDGNGNIQPTALIDFEERICMAPDRGFFSPGIWTLDSDTHDVIATYGLPGSFVQGGGAGTTDASSQYGHPQYAQRGREAYVAFPDTGSGSKKTYIVGTGDYGRTWHLLYTYDWGSSGGSLSTGIVGPDLKGNLYMTPFQGDAPFGSGIMTAPCVTWTWETPS